MLDTPNLLALDPETRDLIAAHGLRNGCLTSIAPTGTTSLLAGNVSSGIEPVFAWQYRRRIRNADGSQREELVEDPGLAAWKQLHGETPPPDALFASAQTLTPSDHLAMQAAAQAFIDSSISKTVNCPEDISFEAFADIYVEGYHLGCKGLTTYRPNAITGSVLSVAPPPASPPAAVAPAPVQPMARVATLAGRTTKLKWPGSPHATYVTINDIDDGSGVRPFEIFINSKNMDHHAWTLALTRMISAVFRRGGDVGFVAEELKAVFDPRGGAWMGGRYMPSILAAIGEIIERHLGQADAPATNPAGAPLPAAALPACCPACGAAAVHVAEGCATCTACGDSRCG